MTTACMFDGCPETDALHRFGPYGLRTGWVCDRHAGELRSTPGGTNIKLALFDAPGLILDDSLVASRSSKDAADRTWRRQQREHRAAMHAELRAMRAA